MQRFESEMLITLAEELNMRKAAEKLFVTQPALSQRLQTIEQRFNSILFLRSTKGLHLTPAGEKIVELAKRMLQEEEEVREQLKQLQGFGTLSLAVASIVAQYWLPRKLKRLLQFAPNIDISLTTGWSSEMLGLMRNRSAQLGIIRGEVTWHGWKQRLHDDPFYLVSPSIKSLSQVSETTLPFIRFHSDSSYDDYIQNWWFETFQKLPKKTIVVDQIETCKQLAYHGVGYTILPESTIGEEGIEKIPLFTANGEKFIRETVLIAEETVLQLDQVQQFVKILLEK